MESNTSVESPGFLIEKEEKGDRIKEKDMVDQEEVASRNSENSTPVQSPGSLIEKEEKGDLIKGKNIIVQEEVGSRNSPTTSVSNSLDILDAERFRWYDGFRWDDDDDERRYEIRYGFHEWLDVLRWDVLRWDVGEKLKREKLEREKLLYVLRWDVGEKLKREKLEREKLLCEKFLFEIKQRIYQLENRMQKMHLLKNYDMLKEELNWPDIISIANNLYIDGHLNWHEWQNILDRSQPRRKAIDILLKAVLGNTLSVSAFMKIMESKSTLSYIAKRINTTQISAKEMKRFDRLEEILQGQRPSIYQERSQKFHLSDSDVGFLIHHFCEKEEVIDQISDLMLSNFLISTHDHTRIFEHAHVDGKILELTELIKTCPDGVYDIFIEVLTKNNMQYVLESLQRNRMPDRKRKFLLFDLDNPPVQKRMKINHNQKGSALEALEKIASGLRVSTIRQKLGNEARKHLDLEFKEAFWGSLGLMFSFQVGEPSPKLKQLVA